MHTCMGNCPWIGSELSSTYLKPLMSNFGKMFCKDCAEEEDNPGDHVPTIATFEENGLNASISMCLYPSVSDNFKVIYENCLPHLSRIKATMSRSAFLVQNPPLVLGLKISSAISSDFAKEQLQEATSTRKMIPFPK